MLLPAPGTPEIPVTARFEGGLTLEGLRIDPATVRPGETIDVTYLWREGPEHVHDPGLFVFVHARQDHRLFQGDHPLPPFPRIVGPAYAAGTQPAAVVRELRVPPDAPPGPWDLHVGLYHSLYGARRKVDTDAETDDNAIIIRNAIHINGK